MRSHFTPVACLALAACLLLTTVSWGKLPPPGSARIELKVKRTKKAKRDGSDYDNRQQKVQFTVNLLNREPQKDYEKLTGYIYGIGQHVTDKKHYKLIIKEKFEFDLARGKSYSHDTQTVYLSFDDNLYAKHGFQYEGYYFEIKDSTGKVILSKGLPKKLEKMPSLFESKAQDTEFFFKKKK